MSGRRRFSTTGSILVWEGNAMPEQPQDSAQSSIDQHQRHTPGLEGQQGYGVEYEDGRYRSDDMQQTPEGGRSGSYESSSTGGYGTSAVDAAQQGAARDQPAIPPDPEAQQGQGGQ